MKRTLQKVMLCAGALLASFGLARVPEQGEVETVAAGITAKLQGILSNRTVESVEWVTLEDSLGVWAVNLAPTGHLILGTSTKFRALLSWSEDDFVTPDAESPQEAMLLELAQRMAEAEAGDGEEDPSWTQSGVAVVDLTAIDASAIVYQPVDPTYWHQHGAMKWYVPGTAPCGCGATALSQVMYATRWPVYSEGFYETSLPYAKAGDLTSSERYAFSPYSKIDYSIMATGVPTDEKTPGNQQIANLVLLAEILSQMTFQPGTAGTIGNFLATNSWTMESILLEQSGGAFSEAAINKMKAAAANGVPIFCTPPAHIVMGSGYAVVDGVHYVRLNYGWGGTSSGWYPMTDRGEYYIAYPKRTAQCDFLPAVSSSTPKLSWHIPLPYDVNRTTKPEGTDIREVNGFTVQAIAIPDEVTEPTTWTDDFSTRAKDCSGNTGALQLISNELQVKTPGWHEPPKASYTWDPIFIPTEETIWTFSYMYNNARGSVQFQILPLGEGWKTLKTINPGNGATSDGWLEESLDLSAYAGTPCKLRLYVHPTYYRTGGTPNQVTFAMKTMGVSETQVITDVVKTIEIDSATVRNYTFTAADGLAVGTQYAFTVTPKFTDGATGIPSLPCITRIANETESFATLTFTSPSIEAAENANMQINQNIFRYCTYAGNSVIRVEANPEANVTDLELYTSHPDAFPETAFTVKKHGNGVFDIVIDGLKLPTWPRVNDCLNLTVCALTEAGTRTSHDLSLTFTDSAELAFIETIPPCPAILADFGDTTTDTGWSAANPTGGSSFEMTDAVTGATLTVAATSGTLQSVSVLTSGFTTSGAFRTPLEEDCTSPLAEMQKTLQLDEMPGVNTYGAAATQSSDGSDLTLTLSDLTVGQCYTLYAIVGGTTVAPSFNLTAYDTTVKAPVVHAVANEGTAYTDLTTYAAGDILLVRAYNIYPTADGEIVLQTSGINALALAETDYAGILYRAEIKTATATWSDIFGGTLPTAKDKVELIVTATDGATLTLDSNIELAELTVSGNLLAVSGSLVTKQIFAETDVDFSATIASLGVLNLSNSCCVAVRMPNAYTDAVFGDGAKVVYKTAADNPVTERINITPTGNPIEFAGGTYEQINLAYNNTPTTLNFAEGDLTFLNEMSFGSATVNITGGTYTTPKLVTVQGGHNRETVINQSGGRIVITGTNEGNDNQASFFLAHHYNGAYETLASTYTLTGGSVEAKDASVRLSQNGYSVVNIKGGLFKVKGIRSALYSWQYPAYPIVYLNLSGGKLSIGSYNWTRVESQTGIRTNFTGGELNAFENSRVDYPININGNLTMSADEGARLTIASTLTANNGTRTITKTGPGELDVSGATLSGTFNFVVNEGRIIVNAGSETASNITVNEGASIGIKLSEEQMISGYTANKAVTFYDPDGVEITDPEMLDGDMAYVPLNTWTATNGNNWSTVANWSKGVLPGSENSVIISISADTTINLTEAVSVEHLSVLGSGILTVSGDFDFDFESFAIAEGVSVALPITDDVTLPIKGSGALIKQGEGTLTLPEDSSLAIQVAAGAISVCDGGTLSGVISGDGKVVVAANQTLTLLGENTYTGGTVINVGATVKIKTANALGSGAITGSGTLECTGVLPANTAGLTDTANWTGTVKLIEGNYTELQLAQYGAKVELAGTTGYLPKSANYAGTVTLSGAGWKSLNGWGGDTITLASIQGDGTLDLTTTAPGNGHCYKITGDTTAFTGSINLGTTKHSVAFGCNTQGTGTIAIGNAVKIANGATWTAPNGVKVLAGGTLGGSGTVSGALTFADGAALDMTSGLLTVSGEVVLPASGFITVKVDASVMPEEGENISIVDGMTTAICSAVLTDGTNRYYAMVSSAGETVSVTRIGEFVSGDIEVSVDEHASISEVMNGIYIEPGSESSLVITFTADNQVFTFDNTDALTFTSIAVNAADGVDGSTCSLVSADGAGSITVTTTTVNTSVDASTLDAAFGALTIADGQAVTIGSVSSVTSLSGGALVIDATENAITANAALLEAIRTYTGKVTLKGTTNLPYSYSSEALSAQLVYEAGTHALNYGTSSTFATGKGDDEPTVLVKNGAVLNFAIKDLSHWSGGILANPAVIRVEEGGILNWKNSNATGFFRDRLILNHGAYVENVDNNFILHGGVTADAAKAQIAMLDAEAPATATFAGTINMRNYSGGQAGTRSASVAVGANATLKFTGTLKGSNGETLRKLGAGTLELSTVDGATIFAVDAGTLAFAKDAAPTNAFTGSGTITADNCTLDLTTATLTNFSGSFAVVNSGILILPAGKEGAAVVEDGSTLKLVLNETQFEAGYSSSATGSVTFVDPDGQEIDSSLVFGTTYVPNPVTVTSSFGVNFMTAAAQAITSTAGFAKDEYLAPSTWGNFVGSGDGTEAIDGTGCTVYWTARGTWNSSCTTDTDNKKLLYGYLDDVVNNGRRKATVTITGLPDDKQYTVALILSGDGDNSSDYNNRYSPVLINGETYSYSNDELVTGDAAVAAMTWGNRGKNASANGELVAGTNVMFVEGISGSILSITSAMDDRNVSRLTIAGVQVWITDEDVVAPEAPEDKEVISLNFSSGNGAVGEATAGICSAAGWNDLTGASGSGSAVNAWNGIVALETSVSYEFASATTWSYATNATDSFLKGYLDDGTRNGVSGATITVSDLPFGEYSVIVYTATDTESAKFRPVQINGTWYAGSASARGAGYALPVLDVEKDVVTWGASRNATAVYGTNALRVDGLTGDLTIQASGKSGSNRGGIAAIQIINTGAAVESLKPPTLPEVTVGEGDAAEVIEIAESNAIAIQKAAYDASLTEVSSIVGAVLSDAKTVDVAGLELFEEVAVELDEDTGVATISYAFGISHVAVEADGTITVTATVSNLDKSEGPSFAEGVIVKLYSGETEIPSTVVSKSDATITIKTEASIAKEFATQPSWSKPLIIKATK